MKRFRVLLVLLLLGFPVLLAAVLAALDTAAADDFLARALPRWAGAAGYQLSLGRLDLEPWAARLTLDGVELRQAPGGGDDGWGLTARRVAVRLRFLQSLLGTPHLELVLDEPRVSGTLPGDPGNPPSGSAGGKRAPRVVLHTVQITDGSVQLRDPGRDLEVVVGAVQVAWVQDAGGGSARDVRVRWRGGEERLDRVEFSGARRFATLGLERLDLEGAQLRLHTRGRIGPWRLLGLEVEGDVRLDGLPEPWLEALHLTRFAPLGGALRLVGHLGGSTDSPEFDGTLELRDGRFGTVRDGQLSTELTADEDGLRFRNLRASSNVVSVDELSGRLRWDDGLWLQARGKAREYRLRPFMGILFPDDFFPVGLAADGEFQVEGPLFPELALTGRGEASVRALDVTTGPEEQRLIRFALPAARLRTRFTVGRQEITFGPSRIETESMDVDISGGRVVYREGLWFSTAAELRSLALARPLLPGWLEARGRGVGQFGGPYRELEFAYDLDLPEVSLGNQPLGRLRGHGEFDLRDLRFTDGHLSGPLGELFASGAVTLTPEGEHDWDLHWERGDLEATAALLRDLGVRIPVALAGAVAGQGRLTGRLAEPEYAGTAELTDLRIDRFRVARGQLEGRASRAGWLVSRADLEAYGAQLSGSGTGGPEAFRSTLDVQGLGVGRFLEQIQVPLPVDGVFRGEVQAGGNYHSARVAVGGRVASPSAYGIPLPDSDLELELDPETLALSATALGGRLEGQLRREFASGALSARATAHEVPWSTLPGRVLPPDLAGASLSGTAELQVDPAAQLAARWEGTAQGISWQELAVGAVAFRGSYAAGAVGFHAAAWDRSVRVEGLVSPEPGAPVELELVLDGFSLPRLRPYLPVDGGTVDGSGRVLLGLAQWRAAEGLQRLTALADLELEAGVKGLRDSRGMDLPDLRLRVTSPDGRPRWRVTARGLELEGALEDAAQGTWRTDARLDQFEPWPQLAHMGPVAELGGRLSGACWLRGAGMAVQEAGGSGRLEELHWNQWGRSNWDWELEFQNTRFTATLREPRGVTLTAGWEPMVGLEVGLNLREVPLAGWVPGPGPAADLSGVVEGRGSLDWPPGGRPRGALELTDLVVRWPPLELSAEAPARLRWEGGTVQLESLSMAGEGVRVTASGSAEPLHSWNLEARSTVDLATLASLLPQVERGQGSVKLGLEVQGPWAEPQLRGPVEIPAGAVLKLAGVPVALEDLDASGALEGNRRFTLDWFDAQVREGRLHLEGGLDLDGWRPGALRFYSEIRDLDLQWPTQVAYRFDADALITGTVAAPQVRGEVRLQEFLYSRSINWRRLVLDALDRKPRQAQIRTEEGVFVDLAVRGNEDVRVENNVAELDLAADLRVRGYLPDPTLWGRVDVLDGAVRVRGRDYEALQSTVEFLGETQPVPQLDLHVRTQTRDYTVNVDVTGPLDNYQVGLNSVPYLTHTDIAALLTLGMTSQEIEGSGNVAGVEAASILTEG
ncbi:MAG TPA: translocation/assembly module TamB domain-containing protein, partial [Deferrisomatales bacterium]|nr:translocation/assembly module TamB domain-containing protein [Deferrisomatales bacterium]